VLTLFLFHFPKAVDSIQLAWLSYSLQTKRASPWVMDAEMKPTAMGARTSKLIVWGLNSKYLIRRPGMKDSLVEANRNRESVETANLPSGVWNTPLLMVLHTFPLMYVVICRLPAQPPPIVITILWEVLFLGIVCAKSIGFAQRGWLSLPCPLLLLHPGFTHAVLAEDANTAGLGYIGLSFGLLVWEIGLVKCNAAVQEGHEPISSAGN